MQSFVSEIKIHVNFVEKVKEFDLISIISFHFEFFMQVKASLKVNNNKICLQTTMLKNLIIY